MQTALFEKSSLFLIIGELNKLLFYLKNPNTIGIMKKVLAALFLVSSVSFVGCAQKAPEAPVEEPKQEAPAAEAPAAAPAEQAAPAAEAPAAAPAAEAPAAK
jgi:hypothetical protein